MKIKNQLSVFAFVLTSLFGTFAHADEFYKCMSLNLGLENTSWTLFLSRSVQEEITTQMTVDQIISASTVQKEIEKVVSDVAQQNMAHFVRNSTTALMTTKDYNFNTEFSHSLRLFTRHLRMRLNALKDKSWTKPITFQIVFAPKISETLIDRRTDGVVPRLSVYPKDRFLVMEQMPDSDSIPKSFNEDIGNLSTSGINLLAHKALSCGSANPYLVSTVLNLSIHPDINSSTFSSQLVVGMPMGTSLPFEQANDQIRFTSVIMPEKVSDLNSATGFAPLSEFPMAFVNMSGTLGSSQVPLLVRFGSIGSLSLNGWERTSGEVFRTKVPRLRGTPVGKIKDLLSVDFSVYNIAAMIDYTKYQNNEVLEIKELNLYISAGLNALAEFKVGMINKKEIDDQFKSEINKTIKSTIEQQTADLKKKSVGIISENTSLQPAEVESLLKSVFSAAKSEMKR
jgi:hypothetical protein